MVDQDKISLISDVMPTQVKQRLFRVYFVAPTPSVASALASELCQDGLLVRSASSVRELAPESFTLPQAFAEPPDVIFLEQPRTEARAVEEIRRIQCHPALGTAALVMVSEDRHYSLLMSSIACGATDYLLLPISKPRLVMQLNRLLGLERFGPMYAGGLFVRNFHRSIEKEIKRSSRTRAPFSILLGHVQFGEDIPLSKAEQEDAPIGEVEEDLNGVFDAYLSEIGRILRETDMVAPFGLREFLTILPFTTREGAGMVRDKLYGVFIKAANSRRNHLSLSLKLGCATYPEDGETRMALIAKAEEMAEI
ncbi:MAG TPA: hypothetical protein PKH07_04670 [bacterium]|nr:hypothetical protein [bacterium]